jgi:septum formation inhibitor MinC
MNKKGTKTFEKVNPAQISISGSYRLSEQMKKKKIDKTFFLMLATPSLSIAFLSINRD